MKDRGFQALGCKATIAQERSPCFREIMTGIIDEKGFRLNVGIIIAGEDGRVFWGRRVGNRDAWQFPQGGMMPGETPEETLFRELEEEVGLRAEHVEIIASTEGWLTYRLPRRFLRRPRNRPHCIGQRQKWFLLKLTASEESIDLFASETPEFKAWRWVNYWYPIRKVVHFKRGVYARALRELAPALKKEVGTLSVKTANRPGGANDA